MVGLSWAYQRYSQDVTVFEECKVNVDHKLAPADVAPLTIHSTTIWTMLMDNLKRLQCKLQFGIWYQLKIRFECDAVNRLGLGRGGFSMPCWCSLVPAIECPIKSTLF